MLGERAAYAKQAIRDKLLDHKQHIAERGDDMLDIRDWVWGGNGAVRPRRADTSADNV
jgi:xylulose-5-phosphate/fructose-6-phosphate phosphoketolase